MATNVERIDSRVSSLPSDIAVLKQQAVDQTHQNNPLLGLPIVAIEAILNFLSYDEISMLRSVCKRMDMICQRVLNQGFLKVERYHSMCQRQVKAQLPRRESERRNHSLARHADILAAVETRLSLLNMTFMKYVDSNLCCFIPGKVIDEIYRVLRYVNSTRAPQRAHEVLQELRDISSMAMEYFDEKIVPILKKKLPGADLSGRLIGSAPVAGSSSSLSTMSLLAKNAPSRSELTKVQQQVKVNGASVTVLRREMQEIRVKQLEQQKQLQDQEQKLQEQTQRLILHYSCVRTVGSWNADKFKYQDIADSRWPSAHVCSVRSRMIPIVQLCLQYSSILNGELNSSVAASPSTAHDGHSAAPV
ncbi:F-box only protein 28 isoform X2 [Syngnathus acus]|uniref:F-box only protein 28 isoform X2 n=1 Tax=Syngnathus acus TaxID=161584 RepID=UPI001885BC0D|nr:F-box only protein 28 isoform X2 [Syngnathus acus]